jgi:hypothetical protein
MPPATPTVDESTPYLFDRHALERLAIYRAAVVARFYTDQIDAVDIGAGIDAERLLESVGEGC